MSNINREFFFEYLHKALYPKGLKQSQVDGHEAILDVWEADYAQRDDRWLAYMLATAYYETARTLQPIEEYGHGHGHQYGAPAGPYGHVYYGRGYVQLTWYKNYANADQELGTNIVQHPEDALKPDIAAKVMFRGMMEGWFTGKKLADYFAPGKADWFNARRIINGLDCAAQIAEYGQDYYAAISYTH